MRPFTASYERIGIKADVAVNQMGRTIPSFRIALAIEKNEWKPFRNALSKTEKKMFDEMWDIPRLYASACSNSCQLVPLHPVIMSILFHHYKELKECKSEIERMQEARVSYNNSSKNKELTIKEEVPTSLDSYFVRNNAN